jgi:hypothetical protein
MILLWFFETCQMTKLILIGKLNVTLVPLVLAVELHAQATRLSPCVIAVTVRRVHTLTCRVWSYSFSPHQSDIQSPRFPYLYCYLKLMREKSIPLHQRGQSTLICSTICIRCRLNEAQSGHLSLFLFVRFLVRGCAAWRLNIVFTGRSKWSLNVTFSSAAQARPQHHVLLMSQA